MSFAFHIINPITSSNQLLGKVALVTGSAKRVGASVVQALHTAGANVVVHHFHSTQAASELVALLNQRRANSAAMVCTELGNKAQAEYCITETVREWGRLDIVINNASSFFATALGEIQDADLHNLLASNVSAPLFVTQAALEQLGKNQGSVINMVDIHGIRPYENHAAYSAAKAALIMLTKAFALELAPNIRVNAIAPGAILWPENDELDAALVHSKIADIPLKRCGTPDDIANLVVYLSSGLAQYITGEIIRVDGGRSV